MSPLAGDGRTDLATHHMADVIKAVILPNMYASNTKFCFWKDAMAKCLTPCWYVLKDNFEA